jgi:hypothetical protein
MTTSSSSRPTAAFSRQRPPARRDAGISPRSRSAARAATTASGSGRLHAERAAGGGSVVRCVMAHHQGMSFLAAVNALSDGLIRRRFFRTPPCPPTAGCCRSASSRRRRPAPQEDGAQRSRPPKADAVFWERAARGRTFSAPPAASSLPRLLPALRRDRPHPRALGRRQPLRAGGGAARRDKGISLYVQRDGVCAAPPRPRRPGGHRLALHHRCGGI